MIQRARAQKGKWRWVVVAAVCVTVVVVGELSLEATGRRPDLGVRAERVGDNLVVSSVQPAGLAWDVGFRPGQQIVAVDGQPPRVELHPSTVSKAGLIEVRMSDGVVATVSAATASRVSDQRRLSFTVIAAECLTVGAVVFMLAADTAVAAVLLALAATAATALLAAVATPLGELWALALEIEAVPAVGASLLTLFLAFPINRLGTSWGRWAAAGCIAATVALWAHGGWLILVAPDAGDSLSYLHRGVLTVEILGAIGLALASLLTTSSAQREARRALELIALGAVAGLMPFALLSLVPQAIGLGALVSPDVAILSVALLPASIGAAILSRQFMGVRHVAQRSLIALIVWLGLLTVYIVGLKLLSAAGLDSIVLQVAIVAGTFAPLQKLLRGRLERLLLSDVYNYADTLRRLAAEIAVLTGVDAVAGHVLDRLAGILDLSWVAIALRTEGSAPLVYCRGACPEEIDAALAAVAESPDGDERAPAPALGDESAHLFALVSEGTAIGTLAVGPKRREADLTPDDVGLITTLAPLVATALRNALLVRTLERQVVALSDREAALEALSARLMTVQEEERRQLALELHDDPLQRAILLARALGEAPQTPQIQRWRQSVDEIIASLRATCTDLHPPVLDDLGLVPGIERLVNNLRARSDLDVQAVVMTGNGAPFGRLDEALEVALYRVAQEALYNCLKHARATKVTLVLRRDENRVELKVVDDGQGYRPDDDPRQHLHLGILGMRERLRPWGGSLSVEATVAGGTVVSAEISLGGENARQQGRAAYARGDS